MYEVLTSNIELCRGDLLQAPVEALVNPVNCVGVMGKGLALQFARAFGDNTRAYQRACKAGALKPGGVLVVELPKTDTGPHFIINLATKDLWRGKSKLAWIEAGLAHLIAEIEAHGIHSVAIPALGCGNGGLAWNAVLPLIEAAFAALPEVRVLVFPPDDTPHAGVPRNGNGHVAETAYADLAHAPRREGRQAPTVDWRRAFEVESPEPVAAFVEAHAGLEQLLIEAVAQLRQAFPDAVLHLSLVDDPETSLLPKRQLWIEIEPPSDVAREQVYTQLDAFDRAWWNSRAGDWFGVCGITLR